jgi:hypothetical protein
MWYRLRSIFSRIKSLLSESHRIAEPGWIIETPVSMLTFLRELHLLVPVNSILYIDMLHIDEIQTYAKQNKVPGSIVFPRGWSNVHVTFPHLPVNSEVMKGLADVCQNRHPVEITNEMIVYHNQDILVTWHDIPDNPIYVSKKIEEKRVRDFCSAAGCSYLSSDGSRTDL